MLLIHNQETKFFLDDQAKSYKEIEDDLDIHSQELNLKEYDIVDQVLNMIFENIDGSYIGVIIDKEKKEVKIEKVTADTIAKLANCIY